MCLLKNQASYLFLKILSIEPLDKKKSTYFDANRYFCILFKRAEYVVLKSGIIKRIILECNRIYIRVE